MKLQRPGTGLLVLRIAVVAVTCLLLLGAGPTWKEKQTWKQAQRAQTAGQHEKVLQLTTLLIEDFPEGDYRQDSHRLAGSAAMALQQWPVARANLETYLQLGGRDDLPKLQFWIALCLAREGKLEVAPAALRNVAVNDPDLVRSAAAARELVELHLFEGNGMAALQGQGLLLQRGNFTTAEDLPVSRRAAETLSDEQLEEIEQDLEHAEVAGLAG